jgi:ribosomal protein L24
MSEFKVGDRVQIVGGRANGMTGTIVKQYSNTIWTIKIPGFKGHDGNANYRIPGNDDKWNLLESNLTKLPHEKESMKIEVKQTKKTATKPKEIVYPCFREANNFPGLVVLFFSKNVGIVVDDDGSSTYRINGEFGDYWNPEVFSEPLQNYSATIFSIP